MTYVSEECCRSGGKFIMLLEISPAIEGPALNQAPADCRVFERKPCEVPTICQPASLLAMKEAGWSATIRDVSQGGVRLQVPRRFEKGTPLAIELPGDRDHDASVVFVNVAHVKRAEDGTWVLGCRFVCELNEDEMQRLLNFDPSLTPAAKEMPQLVENRTLSNVHFQLAVSQGSQISCVFKSFNAAKCWPLAPGKALRLDGHSGNQTQWSLRVQLLECKQEADAWHLRAKLVHAPSLTGLLQALGSCR
jgi:hypothetical protein